MGTSLRCILFFPGVKYFPSRLKILGATWRICIIEVEQAPEAASRNYNIDRVKHMQLGYDIYLIDFKLTVLMKESESDLVD